MKLIHTADWHIGDCYSSHTHQGVNYRRLDGYLALIELVTKIVEEEQDAPVVVVSGDVFDGAYPTPLDVYLVQSQLLRLSQAGKTVYLLAGNHDTVDVNSELYAHSLLSNSGQQIYSSITPRTIYHLADGLDLLCLNHLRVADQSPDLFTPPDQGKVNLIALHGGLIKDDGTAIKFDGVTPREVLFPTSLLECYHKVLLGHIHEFQQVNDKTVYCGSTFRRGWTGAAADRGYLVHDLETGSYTRKFIHQRCQVELTTIDELTALLQKQQEAQTNPLEVFGASPWTGFELSQAYEYFTRLFTGFDCDRPIVRLTESDYTNQVNYSYKPLTLQRTPIKNKQLTSDTTEVEQTEVHRTGRLEDKYKNWTRLADTHPVYKETLERLTR